MMPISYNKNWEIMTDLAIVKEICTSLKQMRLNKNIAQEQLAKLSGLNRVTISRIEAGRSATLLTIIQVLRALDKLNILNAFKEEPEISPIQLLKVKEQQRLKASPKKNQ
ncbi:MAG: helix-turn-helix transcriptional regulator [Ignavibacteria bacterium]|nr:helix-turn-helix transcriptional regulator [Ignavibacteria bacterium]